uniref:Uncharacterized protein n=1 Tax=Parascaris equorum TaxID=6256 RepID=A0A914R3P7_PAREQ
MLKLGTLVARTLSVALKAFDNDETVGAIVITGSERSFAGNH